jgi:hypothetical protein
MSDGPEVVATIVAHADAVAARLRADDRLARTVVLKVKLADPIGPGKYPLVNRNYTLAGPTNDGRVLSRAAVELWPADRRFRDEHRSGALESALAPRSANP